MCSLRAYAYDLLNLAKWFRVSLVELSGLTQSLLLDYISFQLDHQPQPAARTVNHRISVTCSVYRFHHGREIPRPGHGPGAGYTIPSPFSHGKNRRVFHRIRMKVPRRIMVPLSAKEVSQFWSSFRNFRDLSLVALMLFNGLRSRETLNLKIEDLRLSQGQVLVQGKGIDKDCSRSIRKLSNSWNITCTLKGRLRNPSSFLSFSKVQTAESLSPLLVFAPSFAIIAV